MKKIIMILLVLCMFLPFGIARAATAETIVEKLKQEESLQALNASIKYEEDLLQIEYNIPDSEYTSLYFPYNGTVIEYTPGEITTYEEANLATSYSMQAIELLRAALVLNGYTEEEIRTFFQNKENEFTYEVNGIEIKTLGSAQEFKSEDEMSTITVTPTSIKIDVSKANLNKSTDTPKEATDTTIEKVVSFLENKENFSRYEVEGELLFTNEIYLMEDEIEIEHTDYTAHYYSASIPCKDNIITYVVEKINSFEEAEEVLTNYSFIDYIMQTTLLANGNTKEEIQTFFSSEDSKFDYEKHGIEYKEIGEEQTFTDDNGTSYTLTPMSIKIDLERASISSKKEYEIIKGEGQTVGNSMVFEFDMDYDTFVSEGKVYVDDKEVSKENYDVSKGSTIVTFHSDYIKTLSNGNHTFKAVVSDGESKTSFIVNKSNNPQTGDHLTLYLILLGISIIGLVSTGIYMKKKNRN